MEALEWIQDWQDYYGKNTINKLEAEFGSGVSDPFISGLVAMRAQNINYYSSLMENAPDDFDFGVMQLPEKEDIGHGVADSSWKYHTEQKILKPLMNSSNIFLLQKYKKNSAKKVLISWQVKQPTRI